MMSVKSGRMRSDGRHAIEFDMFLINAESESFGLDVLTFAKHTSANIWTARRACIIRTLKRNRIHHQHNTSAPPTATARTVRIRGTGIFE